MDFLTEELCPYCGNEVTILSDNPSECPICGKIILPYSMCDMDKIDCNKCKFYS